MSLRVSTSRSCTTKESLLASCSSVLHTFNSHMPSNLERSHLSSPLKKPLLAPRTILWQGIERPSHLRVKSTREPLFQASYSWEIHILGSFSYQVPGSKSYHRVCSVNKNFSDLGSQALSVQFPCMSVEGDILAGLLPCDLCHYLQSSLLWYQLLLSQLLHSDKP